MAREYGFTPKEKQTYYQQQKLYSSFGRDLTNDYIVLCVYGLDDVLIGTKILTLQEVNIDELTPVEALMKLNEIKRTLKDSRNK